MTPYDILGVKKDADGAEIKRAARDLMRAHHPDKGGDEAAFKAVNHAYSTLKDPDRRAHYDATGEEADLKDVNAQALSIISEALRDVVSTTAIDVITVRVVELIRAHISEPLEKLKADLAASEESAAVIEKRLQSMEGRFITKKEDTPRNLFDDLLRAHRGLVWRQRENIARARKELEPYELALLILKDYGYRYDEPPPQEYASSGVSYTSLAEAFGNTRPHFQRGR